MLYAGLKELEAKLFKNRLELWSVVTETLENISFIVMIYFVFIDVPKELTENSTCKMADFQFDAGGCTTG